ncbi:MAG: type II toxin-antitoxin system RelE/ParE family toxin [Gammaproteobacteria bacterium]|nr:MAG: type II toxin-antitoxin system RelE/ParE family toxin [Gammaproteobacteria bacterium]
MIYEFHPEAEAEFLESVGFYESRVKGLGEAFVDEFEFTINRVCDVPKQHQIECEPDIRRASLQRFPFALIYREKQSKVQVLAVAHNRRRPQYWLGRYG